MVLKGIYSESSTAMKTVIILISVMFLAVRIVSPDLALWLDECLPFGLFNAIMVLSMGVIVRYIVVVLCSGKQKKTAICLLCFLWVVLTITFKFWNNSGIEGNIVKRVVFLPVAVSMIFVLFKYISCVGGILGRFMQYFGRISFPVYLVHVIIYNIILMVFVKSALPYSYVIGLVSYFSTVLLSIIFTEILRKRFNAIYKFVFQA